MGTVRLTETDKIRQINIFYLITRGDSDADADADGDIE